MELYRWVVLPFTEHALKHDIKLVYFRFAHHPPLLDVSDPRLDVRFLSPSNGFDSFTREIHRIAEEQGLGVCYVFDSLSELLTAWATDLMVGNFFSVTCPYLLELKTIAYFLLLRSRHSYSCVARIREVTQLLLDLHHPEAEIFLQPLKVENRYSPTMFLPHVLEVANPAQTMAQAKLEPITSSVQAASLLKSLRRPETLANEQHFDFWTRLFWKASALNTKADAESEKQEMVQTIASVMFGRDLDVQRLIQSYLSLNDLLEIQQRMIGSGFIGGKATGLLLARAILRHKLGVEVVNLLEDHDSFYIGSDVFYTFLVRNNLWKSWVHQKSIEDFWDEASQLRQAILEGRFSEEEQEEFLRMLEYFGQSPLIVRSSSLLEDGYGNAFAGKYESIFLTNQGSPDERLAQFMDAAKRVYASLLSPDALEYLQRRGLQDRDEQMSLLVMRVSGSAKGVYFHPDVAGVAFSRNPYPWKQGMNLFRGLVRLVYGLGTRAVDRHQDDYARLISFEDPHAFPWLKHNQERPPTQRLFDTLNLEKRTFETLPISQWATTNLEAKLSLFGDADHQAAAKLQAAGWNEVPWNLDFRPLVERKNEILDLERIVATLDAAYGAPIDMEFTLNYDEFNHYKINVLQCRRLPTYRAHAKSSEQTGSQKRIELIRTTTFFGPPDPQDLDVVVRITPQTYLAMTEAQRHDAARQLGKILRTLQNQGKNILLSGPGRWGSSTPGLGLPVGFGEIASVRVLTEEAFTSQGWTPEISYGSHFFQDLVEAGISYLSLAQPEAFEAALKRLAPLTAEELTRLDLGTFDWLNLYRLPHGRLWFDWEHAEAVLDRSAEPT